MKRDNLFDCLLGWLIAAAVYAILFWILTWT